MASILTGPRLAHVVLAMPVGGTEKLAERMVRFPPQPFRATCICLDSLGELGEGLRRDGIEVVCLNRKPGFDWTLPWKLAKYAREKKITIFHCHQYTPWFYGILAKLFYGKLKILFTEHGRFYPDIPSIKRKFVNRLLAPLTHAITAVSPSVKVALMQVESFPEKQIQVVYNGVQPLSVAMEKEVLRRKLGLHPDWVYFILCARFDTIKWIPGLIEAFKIVAERHPQSGLILVGNGPESDSIQARIQALKLKAHVHLPGFQNNIGEWLKAADIFVLSSLSEGTSVSLIESMSMGLPSVATRVGGNVEVIEDGVTGILVPSENSQALAEAMLDLLEHPEKRQSMGAAAHQRFEKRFRLEPMFASYHSLYLEMLART